MVVDPTIGSQRVWIPVCLRDETDTQQRQRPPHLVQVCEEAPRLFAPSLTAGVFNTIRLPRAPGTSYLSVAAILIECRSGWRLRAVDRRLAASQWHS